MNALSDHLFQKDWKPMIGLLRIAWWLKYEKLNVEKIIVNGWKEDLLNVDGEDSSARSSNKGSINAASMKLHLAQLDRGALMPLLVQDPPIRS